MERKLIASTPPSEGTIAKAVSEDEGLVTAIVLRPDVADLHGDIYDAAEVQKACFGFNTLCRQTNVQHEEMADFEVVESFIAKSDFQLGEGMVKRGDWVATMHIDTTKAVWQKVKSGDFTGFSIGCKAEWEML